MFEALKETYSSSSEARQRRRVFFFRLRAEEVAELCELGSELGQGFYYSEPLSDDTKDGMPMLLRKYRSGRHGPHGPARARRC